MEIGSGVWRGCEEEDALWIFGHVEVMGVEIVWMYLDLCCVVMGYVYEGE